MPQPLKKMKYNLIADAGSSKIDWLLADANWKELRQWVSPGVNALMASDAEIEAMADSAASQIPRDAELGEIHFYGSGCATPEICSRIADALRKELRASSVSVYTDLLGAARSLLGHKAGIACILGTGSNSCLYNGKEIEQNVPSLGFILGDEGSGAALGKRLVADAFKGHLPKVISDKFLKTFNLDLGAILKSVYRAPTPNKFLASLVPFLSEHLWNPYVYSLVRQEFELFLVRNVSPYKGSRTLPIAFTGSIAYHFSDILKEAASRQGFKVGEICRRPIEGLLAYHASNTQNENE